MILVFGGTTEGRKAVEVLEEAGHVYYYSTKTGEQDITLHHGIRVDGAMDADKMASFLHEHHIRLLIDAAHPFALQLHQTIIKTAQELEIPIIRYERIYPKRDSRLTWIDDYSQVPADMKTLLATTGVQSISKLKHLETQGVHVIYRILPRLSSISLAKKQGANEKQLCYYSGNIASNGSFMCQGEPIEADAILMKESGLSGGFQEKVDNALSKGMRVIVLKRPQWSTNKVAFTTVNGPYGLRRAVEQLLPDFFPLKSGLTTGTCATAAAIAATIRLVKNEMPKEVPVRLPNGETINIAVSYGADYAYCIKQAGDDPDVTDGIEIRASVRDSDHFEINGGYGVGRFTLPGFDYPPGEAAINRSPRQMMRENIKENVAVTIIVPDGQEVARKTFNPRLGIVGGISIIGVSGIVKPFSEEAFINSIRKCMEVAKASGTDRVVINSGAKSERYVRTLYPSLPYQAFVEYGNYIGETLKIAEENGIGHIILGVMLGKAVKLAEGHLDTHSRRVTMNRSFIKRMLEEAHCETTADYTLARELWQVIPKEKIEVFSHVVISHCYQHCKPLVPHAKLTILLIDDDGTIHSL